MSKPLTDMSKFQEILKKASKILVLSGAGISAESGIPTFRGSGGFWRTYKSQDLATVGAFKRSPSLVWEFYHYRREVLLTKQPNKAHFAVAEAEKALAENGKQLTVVTQNVDDLHKRAGSSKVIELHGSLFKTRCIKCHRVATNTDSPIVPALLNRGGPDTEVPGNEIPLKDLPHCNECGGLLRPHIVWFGENLEDEILAETEIALSECEACLVIGTSSVVYPAAMYAPALAARNIPVAEFNLEPTPATDRLMFHFEGPCSLTVPEALSVLLSRTNAQEKEKKSRHLLPSNCQIPFTGVGKLKREYFPLMLGSVRNYATKTGGEGVGETEKPKTTGETKEVTLKEKFKLAIRDYGSTVIVFHIGHSLALLGIIYVALSSGLDVKWLLESVGLGGSSIAAGASTAVVAYAVNKVLAPVRFSITLAVTPFLVRYLRRIGLLKRPTSPPS